MNESFKKIKERLRRTTLKDNVSEQNNNVTGLFNTMIYAQTLNQEISLWRNTQFGPIKTPWKVKPFNLVSNSLDVILSDIPLSDIEEVDQIIGNNENLFHIESGGTFYPFYPATLKVVNKEIIHHTFPRFDIKLTLSPL